VSIAVMSAAWKADVGATDKIVLLALADRADDSGKCWPGVGTLAKKCGLSDRTVQRSIQALSDAGHLSREDRSGTSSIYFIHPSGAQQMQGYTPPEYHYVYRTSSASGEFYIGARSCLCDPKNDKYLGSGGWVAEQRAAGVALKKEILESYPTREALSYGELSHVAAVYKTPLCRNRKLPTPGTLSATGYRGTPDSVSPRQAVTPTDCRQTPDTVSPNTSVIHQPVTVTAQARDHFSDFWAVYPKRAAKRDAEKAFAAAVKRGVAAAHITASAARYAAYPPDDPQFIPHPATWLNRGSYDDEPLASKPKDQRNGSATRLGPAPTPKYRYDPAWEGLKRLHAELEG
jgi:hypothetical protein